MQFLELLFRVAMILFAALEAYDQTPEGKAAIDALFLEVEDAGFDIPWWEPDANQPPIDLSFEAAAIEGIDTLREAFLRKHPGMASAQEGEG